MKKIAITATAALLLTACAHPTDASKENFTQGVKSYLGHKGSLCLGRYQWPVYVPEQEFASGGRDAVQMPVLEKAGLVKSTEADMPLQRSDTQQQMMSKVRVYELTDEGRKYLEKREFTSMGADGKPQVTQKTDVCALHLSLDHVTNWTTPTAQNGKVQTVVSYQYTVQAAPWMSRSDVQQAFPMLTTIVNGAGKLELKEGFVQNEKGWTALETVD